MYTWRTRTALSLISLRKFRWSDKLCGDPKTFSRGRLKKTGEIHKWLYVCLFVTLNNIFSRCCWMTFCKISPSALKKKLSQLFFYDSAVLILPAFCVRLRQLEKNRRRDSKNKSQTIIPVLIIFSHMCVCINLADTCFFLYHSIVSMSSFYFLWN
jgi:hypothetical protein